MKLKPYKTVMIVYIFIWIHLYALTTTTIIRLECKLHANFSVKLHRKRYEGPLLKTISLLSYNNCSLLCLFTENCTSSNYNSENMACELINHDSYQNKLQNHIGWWFTTTKFYMKNRGPTCLAIKPCTDQQVCFETCDETGYKCVDVINLSNDQSTTIEVSHESVHTHSGRQTKKEDAIDGNINTYLFMLGNLGNRWIRFKFEKKCEIHYTEFVIRNSGTIINLEIGNSMEIGKNPVCKTISIFHEKTTKRKFECDDIRQ